MLHTESWESLTSFKLGWGGIIKYLFTLPSRVIHKYTPFSLQTPHKGGYQSIFVVSPCLKLSDVVHWGSKVMRAVSKCAVGSIFDTVPSRVSLIDTRARLVVAKMVAPLSVSSCPMEIGTSVCAHTCVCGCVCACVRVCVCACVCVRESEREKERYNYDTLCMYMMVCTCVCVHSVQKYTYMYYNVSIHVCTSTRQQSSQGSKYKSTDFIWSLEDNSESLRLTTFYKLSLSYKWVVKGLLISTRT